VFPDSFLLPADFPPAFLPTGHSTRWARSPPAGPVFLRRPEGHAHGTCIAVPGPTTHPLGCGGSGSGPPAESLHVGDLSPVMHRLLPHAALSFRTPARRHPSDSQSRPAGGWKKECRDVPQATEALNHAVDPERPSVTGRDEPLGSARLSLNALHLSKNPQTNPTPHQPDPVHSGFSWSRRPLEPSAFAGFALSSARRISLLNAPRPLSRTGSPLSTSRRLSLPARGQPCGCRSLMPPR
jgi:hypothetical protein